MTWEEYTDLFDTILSGKNTDKPYDNPAYSNYVSLNHSRQKRWMKRGVLNDELVSKLESLDGKQTWTLITEPWCGDASHIAPFLARLAESSSNIDFSINLRDGEDSMIHDYLTNGGMSIPILVVKDENGSELFHWGPRPKDAQTIHLNNREDENKSSEDKKIELQGWYNKDKGTDLQLELLDKFENI